MQNDGNKAASAEEAQPRTGSATLGRGALRAQQLPAASQAPTADAA